ncbi:hypothetical protein DFJ73DRAFT_228260 [Zopfochytrium polystomum]|nr:hypothetical protein DFJ73DRAFT_228260 [Zopfochytrium polystomum]
MESPRAATAPLFSDAAAAVGTPAATGPPTPLAPPSSIVLHGQAAAAAAATAQQLLLAKVGATTAMQSVAAMAAASPTGPERTFSVRLGGTGADSPSSDGKLAVFGTGSFRGTGSLKLIPEAAIAKSLLARKATISSAEFGRAHQGTPSPPNLLPPASNNTDRNQPLPDKGKLPYYMWNAISSAIGLSQQAAPRSPSGKSAGDDNVPRLSISTASVASAPAAESIQTAFTMGSVPFHSPPSTPCEQELSAGKADYHLDSITKNPAQNQVCKPRNKFQTSLI